MATQVQQQAPPISGGQPLSEFFARHTPAQLDRLRQGVQSRLREQEVSYNLLGTPDFSYRPWKLDERPHLIGAQEFDHLAQTVARRAQLLTATLEDLFGRQRLVREGVVPAEVLFDSPHFYRAFYNLVPSGGRGLLLYASDLVKTVDGRYLVHSDRTSAPTGSGYALENRLAIGQILSEPFRKLRTRKINGFFEILRDGVRELAPRGTRVPRVVLLTPGIFDESSFEHAYLARYQGFQLVEGRDLTVRGESVFLKTLGGLEPVDVILRRVADEACDPLELLEDSELGVAGLMAAARAGNVGLANALGSGVAESPALRAYLPAISQALFGEPLALESIPTRYLGDAAQRQEVLDSFGDWIIRPAFGDRRGPPKVVATLEPAAREALMAQVLREPDRLVAEQWPEAGRVPVGAEGAVTGRLSLRLFACAHGSGYYVMPGGLGRIDASPDGLFLAAEDFATTQDVWVVGHEEAAIPTPPRMPETDLSIRRGGVNIPSRLFDDLFWLGRYAERCYGTARLARAGLEPLASEDRVLPPDLTTALLKTLVSLQVLTPAKGAAHQLEKALMAAVYESAYPSSIRSCLQRVGSLTVATRSRLSPDTWRILRKLSRNLDGVADNMEPDAAVDQLDSLLIDLAAFDGITGSTMVRGHAWVFLQLGRRLEHAAFVLTLLGQMFASDSHRRMETLLSICDSLMTYRSRYLSALQPAPVVDLVLTDDTNPQSVLFQVRRLLECVRSLPRERQFPLSRAEKRLITLQAQLETANLNLACRGEARDLQGLVEDGINLLWQVSDDLTQTYFAHSSREMTMRASERADLEKSDL